MPEVWFPNLGIEIAKLNNVAVTVFGIDLYWYGVIIGIGLVLGFMLAYFTAKKSGQNADLYVDFIIIAIVTCVISARLYYVIFSWDQYKDNLIKIFAIREGGLAIYGAVIAAIITAFIFAKKKNLA
jgi:phosphatidylglycerol:prolipoprotein diacylglycerol transferase